MKEIIFTALSFFGLTAICASATAGETVPADCSILAKEFVIKLAITERMRSSSAIFFDRSTRFSPPVLNHDLSLQCAWWAPDSSLYSVNTAWDEGPHPIDYYFSLGSAEGALLTAENPATLEKGDEKMSSTCLKISKRDRERVDVQSKG